jgi:ubiquinone/menaquinone biosynthesis C-methylase UbiE
LFAYLYFLQGLWEPLGLARHRRAVARGVRGRALEIGVGTGFSLPSYEPAVACDPNMTMLRKARRRARRLGMEPGFVDARGEALPFADGSFDTVVSQVVLCTVASPEAVAREMRRMLAPGGIVRCVEHGIASRPTMAWIQRALTPFWRRLFGGCRLDRDVVTPFLAAGLEPERLRRCSGGSVVRATLRAEEMPATRAEAG